MLDINLGFEPQNYQWVPVIWGGLSKFGLLHSAPDELGACCTKNANPTSKNKIKTKINSDPAAVIYLLILDFNSKHLSGAAGSTIIPNGREPLDPRYFWTSYSCGGSAAPTPLNFRNRSPIRYIDHRSVRCRSASCGQTRGHLAEVAPAGCLWPVAPGTCRGEE